MDDLTTPPIRIIVADDQALIRRGISLLLAAEPDMTVVGQASDGVDAVQQTLALRPDVVLMDLHMPRKGGVAATREIMLAVPGTHVLVLTTLDHDETVFEAVRAGAQAYLLKDASEQELLHSVRAVCRGESWLTPQIARKVMDQFRSLGAPGSGAPQDRCEDAKHPPGIVTSPPASAEPSSPDQRLNHREERILELIAEGKSNKQIAATIFLAEGTVKNYVSRIMEKLHANTRTELAVMSLRQQRRG